MHLEILSWVKNEIKVKHLITSPRQGNASTSAVPPALAAPSGVGDVARLDPAGGTLEHPGMAQGEEGTRRSVQPHAWWLRCFNPAPAAGIEAEMKPSPAPAWLVPVPCAIPATCHLAQWDQQTSARAPELGSMLS